MAWTGHKSESGMLGSGMKSFLSWCCSVFDHLMRRMAPAAASLRSPWVRCLAGEKADEDGTVRFDLRKNEKNATKKRHHMAAWEGRLRSKAPLMSRSMGIVMGYFCFGADPMRRFNPLLVRVTSKLARASHVTLENR